MIFVRHPVTDAPPNTCYGHRDVGLGAEAEDQIAGVIATLARPAAIRSSDLSRCRILADRLGRKHGLGVLLDARLREYHFGAWEGRAWRDIPHAETEHWLADLWARPAPGGESFADLHGRVTAALAECSEGDVVICHAGVIRAAWMVLQGAAFDEVVDRKVPFCTPIRIDRGAA